jgi:hypothetical protein
MHKKLPAYVIAELEYDGQLQQYSVEWILFKNDAEYNEVEVLIKGKESVFDNKNWVVKRDSDFCPLIGS